MRLRPAKTEDTAFVIEMARLACGLEDRPLPGPDAAEVIALLPTPGAAIIAADDDGRPLGAAWWHVHEPPLLHDADGQALPQFETARAYAAVLILAAFSVALFGALSLAERRLLPWTQSTG